MMQIKENVKKIIEDVGGNQNINQISHCATRLRFQLKDMALVKKEDIQALEGILGCNVVGNECQVIIGQDVQKYYREINGQAEITPDHQKKKVNIGYSLLDFISGTMTPLIPALIGSSVIRGVLILLTQFQLMDASSSTYFILYAASNAVFYFLPILAAFSAAKKLDVNPYIAACISATLMEPNFAALLTETGNIVDFFQVPVMMFNYSASLLPALLATYVYALLWNFLENHMPSTVSTILNPALSLAVCVPLTAIVFGPIAYYFGQFAGNLFQTINSFSPVIAGIFIGVSMNYLVISGMHWVITALCLVEFNTIGYSTLFGYWWCACISYIAIALGAIFVAKGKKERSLAVSCSVVAVFGGVSEPTLYTYLLRNKKYAIPMAISGALAGGLAGLFGCKATAFSMATVFTLPCVEIGGSFLYAIVVFLLAIFAGIVSTILFVGKEKGFVFQSPMTGMLISIEKVNDSTFASKALGDGFAIIPEENHLYAPFDGEVISLYPTKHAIGLKDRKGDEVLIHLGIDSVHLNGEGIKLFVNQGDQVKQGELLMQFDEEIFKDNHIDQTTPIIFMNGGQLPDLEEKRVLAKEDLFIL